MTIRRTAIAAAILTTYAVPAVSREDVQQPPTAADDVQVLSPVDIEGKKVDGYKAESAQSPKFTAPLLDTPRSFTVISEDLLRDTAADSLQDALRQVPGITFLAGEGGQPIADRPVIRGINSTANLFVDGVRDIGSQTRRVFDIESVEILKGTDSVYAGRGGGGGSVNLVSKTAGGEDFQRGAVTIGTADTLRATVDGNWMVSDTAAFRVGVLGEKAGVPGRDSVVESDAVGVSPSLAFGLGSQTRMTLDYYHVRESGIPDYSIPYDLASGEPVTETLGIDEENFYGLLNRDFLEGETDIATAIVHHELTPNLRLRNLTRWGKSTNSYVVTNPDDSRGNVEDGFVYRSSKNRWSQTKTLANQTDLSGVAVAGRFEHSYNIGLEFIRENKEQDGYNVVSAASAFGSDCSSTEVDPASGMTFGELLRANGDCTSLASPTPADAWMGTVTRRNTPTVYETDATAIYAFDTVKLSDHWQISAGLRWDRYETEATSASDPTLNAYADDTFINYQLGAVFKPVANGSIYVSYGTQTTPATLGTGDEDTPQPDSPADCTRRCRRDNTQLDPEESVNIELGTKWDLFDQRLRVTAAIFDITRENASIEVSAGVFEQVGETRVTGAEIGFAGGITERWHLFGGYSYLDSELVRSGFEDTAEGQQLTNTPEHSVSLLTNYDLTERLTIGGGANYVSEVFGSVTSDPRKTVPAYWRYDAMAAWEILDAVEVQLNVQNLSDEVYYTKAYASHYAAKGPGRQVLLTTHFSF